MPRARTLTERIEEIRPEHARPTTLGGGGDRPPWVRYWGIAPVVAIVALLALRACLHAAPLDHLAEVAGDAGDPPGTTARAGAVAIARGGPVIIGFQSDTPARLQLAGRDLRGKGLVKDRIIVPHGPAAIRFAAPPGARLVWSPVGRRGDPEYLPANSLSPDPPERATFDHAGAAPLDGAIALAILAVIVATLAMLARRRLAAVSRDTWIAMAVMFAGALAVRLIGLGDQGQTWDEDVNWAAGRNYVTNLLSLDFSERSWIWNYEHPPVMKYLDGIGAQFADGFGPARALSAVWISLGCALLVPIGARLYRFRVGVLAAAIAALLPPLVAHGQIVGHESPTVLWWTLGILLSLGVHDYLPSDDRRARRALQLRLAWIGVVIGIAIASRFASGLLGPLCAAIVVLQAPTRWRRATIVWGLAVMPVVAVVTLYAVWPRLWAHPIAHLGAAFAKLKGLHAAEPFLGTLTSSPGPHYFLIYLGATAPIGVLVGVVAWLARVARRRDRWTASVIVGAWFAIPLVGIMLSPVRQDGVRYVMPCVVVLAVMAAAGVDFAAGLVERWFARAFRAAAAVVILYLGVVAVRTAPYFLDYFGEHTGGAGAVAARRSFETAWWGEGLDRAIAYVDEHAGPDDKILNPGTCIAPYHMAWFGEGLWTRMTPSATQATWIVSYAPDTLACRVPPDAHRVFAVEHDGVVLAAVYKRP